MSSSCSRKAGPTLDRSDVHPADVASNRHLIRSQSTIDGTENINSLYLGIVIEGEYVDEWQGLLPLLVSVICITHATGTSSISCRFGALRWWIFGPSTNIPYHAAATEPCHNNIGMRRSDKCDAGVKIGRVMRMKVCRNTHIQKRAVQ